MRPSSPSVDSTQRVIPYSIKTEPHIEETEFTAVLGASGVNNALAEPAGIERFVFCQKESLGIVCYFPNLETLEETKVKEFSWTTELKHKMLNKMREVGIDLENIVYFRGEMHYLVMTPKRHNLVVRRVVKKNHPNSKDLVRADNINQDAFHLFVNDIVNFVGIPRKADFARVSIFDFSSLTRADKAASILTSHGKKLYVGLIGDSLLGARVARRSGHLSRLPRRIGRRVDGGANRQNARYPASSRSRIHLPDHAAPLRPPPRRDAEERAQVHRRPEIPLHDRFPLRCIVVMHSKI